jgi:hypothetical protein
VLVAAVLVVLVVAMAVFDAPSSKRHPVAVPAPGDEAQIGALALPVPTAAARARSTPVAAPIGAASSTWFCGGGAPSGAAGLATTLLLTNRSDHPVTATITATSSVRRQKVSTVVVPARSTERTGLDVGTKGMVAAVVESRGGGLVVDQRIGSGSEVAVAACATSSSASWYFAGGDTQRGSKEQLVLFNPFDDLATADLTFVTPDGFRRPQATQGLPVPGRSVVVVDAASVQNRRSNLASAVTTRAGRLVVWRTQTFDGSGPKLDRSFAPHGVSVALGATSALTHFALPTAATGEGIATRIVLANLGTVDSTLRLSFHPDDPATNGQPPDATVKIPAGTVQLLGTGQLRQVPAGVPFSVSGTVTGGGPIVAELWLDGADPAKGHGSSASPAIPVSSTSWVMPIGLGTPALDLLGVSAPGSRATVTVTVLDKGRASRLRGPQVPRRVPAGGRITFDLATLLADHPGATVLVTSSSPVVVSRLQAGADAHGLVSTAGLPAGPLALPDRVRG